MLLLQAKAAGCLSLAGAGFICLSFVVLKPLRSSLSYRLVFYLSFSDFMVALAHVMDFVTVSESNCGSGLSVAAAVLHEYFTIAGYLWICCFAANLYVVLGLRMERERAKHLRLERIYHFCCWGFPAVSTIVFASNDCYGDSGNWSSIKASGRCEPPRFWFHYLELFAAFVWVLATFWLTRRDLGPAQSRQVSQRLGLYLAAFLSSSVFGVANRLQRLAQPGQAVFALYVCQSVTTPLKGLFNALVYGLNKRVKQEWKRLATGVRQPQGSGLGLGLGSGQFQRVPSASISERPDGKDAEAGEADKDDGSKGPVVQL